MLHRALWCTVKLPCTRDAWCWAMPAKGVPGLVTRSVARAAVRMADEVVEHPITRDQALQFYRHMVLARSLDDRIWLLARQGAIPFAVSGRGHEAAQVALAMALRPGLDYTYPYYRDVAFTLALGLTAEDIMLAAFARAADPSSGGRQMLNHFSRKGLRIVSGSSPVGSQIPQAAGTAWAIRLRQEDAVVMVTFGEGASSEGDFHEGLNLAGIHRLPIIFVCENNGWAISVPERLQVAPPGVAARGAAYGMPGVGVDGTDPLECYRVAIDAVARARAGDGPTLIEARLPRLDPHTSSDDDATYRSAAERAKLAASDPLPKWRHRLLGEFGCDAHHLAVIDEEMAGRVDAAMAMAEASPAPHPDSLLDHVSSGDEGI